MNKLYLSRSRIAQALRGVLLFSITMMAVIHTYAAHSLQVLVTFEAENMPITAVLDKISKQTNVAIFQNNNQTDLARKVTVNFKNEKLENVLDNLLSSTNLTYRIDNDLIVIIPTKDNINANENQVQQTPKEIEIEGLVVDVKGEPLIAVNILIVGTTKGTSTDLEGKFKLKVPAGTTKIKFSYLGFDDLILDFNPGNTAVFSKIVMNEAAYSIDNVVVTGYFDRTKSSFTGSQVTVKGDELRKVGSLNFMQAISAFDEIRPSIAGELSKKMNQELNYALNVEK